MKKQTRSLTRSEHAAQYADKETDRLASRRHTDAWDSIYNAWKHGYAQAIRDVAAAPKAGKGDAA